MSQTLGVGILGAGPVTQAIHLPTLANLADRFDVVGIMDIDADVADCVARRCDATSTTIADRIIDDPHVEIVAVCSPNAAHAAQVIAACEAGKRAVLCEKPLAISAVEAQEIRHAAAASGTQIVVGAMHVYDPAFRAAREAWDAAGEVASFTQSSIMLPANDVFIDQATQITSPPAPSAVGSDGPPPTALMLRFGILGLTIHNLPLIRQFHPVLGQLVTASFLPPLGYDLVVTGDHDAVELIAYMGVSWPPSWTLRIVGQTHELRINFPPSYVLSGSARAEFVNQQGTRLFEFADNGYQRQWMALHAAVVGDADPLVSLDEVVDDITYALELADQVDALLGAPT